MYRNLWKFNYFGNMTATTTNRMKQPLIYTKKQETTAQLIKRLVIAYYAKKGVPCTKLNEP